MRCRCEVGPYQRGAKAAIQARARAQYRLWYKGGLRHELGGGTGRQAGVVAESRAIQNRLDRKKKGERRGMTCCS